MVLKAFEKKTVAAAKTDTEKKADVAAKAVALMEKKAASESGGLDSGEAPTTCKWCEKGTCWKKDCPTRAEKKSSQPCRFFAKSQCKQGDACPYRHDLDAEDLEKIEYCVFFSKGQCTKGDACTFNHDFDPDDPEVKKTMNERKVARATAFNAGPKGKGKGKGKWGYESYDDGAAEALGAILALALAGEMAGGWEEESWEEPAQQQVKGFGKGGGKSGGLKTRLCTHWQANGGFCPRGGSCSFAHGEQELGTPQAAGGMTHLDAGMGGYINPNGRMMVGSNPNPNPQQRARILGGGLLSNGMGMQGVQGGGLAGARFNPMGNAKGGGKGGGRLDKALEAGGACKWCQQGQCWTHGTMTKPTGAMNTQPTGSFSSSDVAAQAAAFLSQIR